MTCDLNVLALIKGGERFVFVYDDESRAELLAAIRDQAADPSAGINWTDAAVLADRLRQQSVPAHDNDPKSADRIAAPE